MLQYMFLHLQSKKYNKRSYPNPKPSLQFLTKQSEVKVVIIYNYKGLIESSEICNSWAQTKYFTTINGAESGFSR